MGVILNLRIRLAAEIHERRMWQREQMVTADDYTQENWRLGDANREIEELTSILSRLRSENEALRKLLWIRHGCPVTALAEIANSEPHEPKQEGEK
jgi:cell shape-determining protein MreC